MNHGSISISISDEISEPTGGGPSGAAIQSEDGTYILQEDGTYILVET